MDTTYSQTGSWVGVAGLIVLVLNHFNINIVPSDVEAVIGALITIYGIVRQYISHKDLAIATGAYVPKR